MWIYKQIVLLLVDTHKSIEHFKLISLRIYVSTAMASLQTILLKFWIQLVEIGIHVDEVVRILVEYLLTQFLIEKLHSATLSEC